MERAAPKSISGKVLHQGAPARCAELATHRSSALANRLLCLSRQAYGSRISAIHGRSVTGGAKRSRLLLPRSAKIDCAAITSRIRRSSHSYTNNISAGEPAAAPAAPIKVFSA
jgi:hypothetical protein